ncbi:envelope stress sensor histidine kinase CpxA [Pasteurellaceae bacterium 22721_9_1]
MSKSVISSLSAKIFVLFWLILGGLLLIAFFIPQLDSRTYRELSSSEIKFYHNELITAMKDRKFIRVLLLPRDVSAEYIKLPHPILVDQQNNIIGASKEELPFVQEFIKFANDPLNPQTKLFNHFSLAGPFTIHLNDDNGQAVFSSYFIDNADPQTRVISYIFDHPLLLMFVVLFLSTPLLAFVAYSLAKPIQQLNNAANAVALGDFTVNKALETKGIAELRQVGKSFNHMSQSLGDLITHQRKWLSAISHELRTPLTRLQLSAALIRRKMGDSVELERIDNEILKLNKMIEELLIVSRNQMMNTVSYSDICLPAIWDSILESARFEAEQMKLEMTVNNHIQKPDTYRVKGNLNQLESAVENIIRNAMKYTHSALEINLSLKDKKVMISVDDNGAGLPEAEYSRIFTPFYRVDEDRTREKGGVGLGLAIVQSTIQSHKGQVWAEKSHLGGLRVVIQLPLWET